MMITIVIVSVKTITVVIVPEGTIVNVAERRAKRTPEQAESLRKHMLEALAKDPAVKIGTSGWTHRAAEAIGIPQSSVSQLYNRSVKDYTLETMIRLSRFCGKNIEELLGETDTEERLRRILREEIERSQRVTPTPVSDTRISSVPRLPSAPKLPSGLTPPSKK